MGRTGIERGTFSCLALLVVISLAVPIAGTTQVPRAKAQTALPGSPVNVASEAGIAETTRTYSAAIADYNRDTFDDIFLVRHDPQAISTGNLTTSIPRLYRGGLDGQFTDVNPSGQLFQGRDRHGCAWGDVNVDGMPDIACAVGLTSASVKELEIQQAGGDFNSRASGYGLTAGTTGRYRTVEFVDANGDPWPDLYFTRYYGANFSENDPTPPEDPPYPNELWINQEGASFIRDPSFGLDMPIGAPKDNDACNQADDVNHDGAQDLLVCGQKGIHLYLNQSNRAFTDSTKALGLASFWPDAELVDVNGDGWDDIVQIQGTKLQVKLWSGGAGTGAGFKQLAFTAPLEGGGINVATGDVDGNGFTDVYAVQTCPGSTIVDQSDRLFLNQGNDLSGTPTWQEVQIPAVPAKRGCGNDVQPLDYNHDAKTDFLVLSGRLRRSGPVQLFTWQIIP